MTEKISFVLQPRETHHLQLTLSARAPPINGPRIAATPYVAPIIPTQVALFLGSEANAAIVYTPGAIPEAPTPAIARPTIRVVEFRATAQIKLPTSNMKIDTRKLVLRGKYL